MRPVGRYIAECLQLRTDTEKNILLRHKGMSQGVLEYENRLTVTLISLYVVLKQQFY